MLHSLPTNSLDWFQLASFPGSSQAFCRILYKKRGAWTIWSCARWRTMRGFMHSFGNRIIAHAHRLRAKPCWRQSESPCWLSQRLMPLTMTWRRPREATTNNCESWKSLLQHEHGYSTRWFQEANFCRANNAIYFRVVHRSCRYFYSSWYTSRSFLVVSSWSASVSRTIKISTRCHLLAT